MHLCVYIIPHVVYIQSAVGYLYICQAECVFYTLLSGAHILILVRSTVSPYKFPDSY